MHRRHHPIWSLAGSLLAALATAAPAQQGPDPAFHPRVARSAYASEHPRVAIDKAHFNFHTAEGSYAPFAALLKLDGYLVSSNDARFTPDALSHIDVLVVANARAGTAPELVDTPAFTPDEVAAVHAWVSGGGSLLLIADHAPFGGGAELLAHAFGVGMSKGVTQDTTARSHFGLNPTFLTFSRDNGLLGDHAIFRGRDSTERVSTVVTFTGQSLVAPPGSVTLLGLSSTAVDRAPPTRGQTQARADRLNRLRDSIMAAMTTSGGTVGGDSVVVLRGQPGAGERGPATFTSAAGHAQGVALTAGKGRVVVLGEAALLSAQMVELPGTPTIRMGMQVPGSDDQQFALNVMHWLSGALR